MKSRLEPIEQTNANQYEYKVLKTPYGYFEDAWEDYGEDDNFSFTNDIRKAYTFGGGKTGIYGAPKYLWNDREGKDIKTLAEAQAYFGGEIINVKKTRVETIKYELYLE